MDYWYIILGVAVATVLWAVLGRGTTTASDVHMPEGTTDEDIRDIALSGKKIEAIKWYRVLHGVGLKEAKDAVEAMTREA